MSTREFKEGYAAGYKKGNNPFFASKTHKKQDLDYLCEKDLTRHYNAYNTGYNVGYNMGFKDYHHDQTVAKGLGEDEYNKLIHMKFGSAWRGKNKNKDRNPLGLEYPLTLVVPYQIQNPESIYAFEGDVKNDKNFFRKYKPKTVLPQNAIGKYIQDYQGRLRR